jgi:hypothetical protein
MPTRSSSPEARRRAGALSRRAFVAAAAVPLLARCSSKPNSDSDTLTRMLGQSLGVFSGGSSIALSEVASVPFASLGVRIGSGPQVLLVLASRSGPSTLWTSASHIALEISSGRILRTAGLAQNLSATIVSSPDPLDAGLQNLHAPARATRTLDFADRNIFGNSVESIVTPAGPAAIDVLGSRVACLHVLERGSCAALGWTFTNEYWVGAKDGVVWRSLQFIHPDLDVVEVALFRPPRL